MLGGGLGVGAAVATDGGFAGLPSAVAALSLGVGGATDDGFAGSPFGVAVLSLDAGGATADFGFGGLDGSDGAGFAGLPSAPLLRRADACSTSLASRSLWTDFSMAAAWSGGPWTPYLHHTLSEVLHGLEAHL